MSILIRQHRLADDRRHLYIVKQHLFGETSPVVKVTYQTFSQF